ncbi:urocortin-3 [Tachyglossus aculeatus]|uniref:urocortin-3 n=1 Tax=Tachyglossus aculeatus TaxID=9261 RepID=UPI0018F6D43A|nr:urocortin-3 [Tachyglossus aculeatus]
MVPSTGFLLLLLLLLEAPQEGRPHKLYRANSIFGYIDTALSAAKKGQLEDGAPLVKRSFGYLPDGDRSWEREEGVEEEEEHSQDKEKRTLPGSGRDGAGRGTGPRSKLLSQALWKFKQHPSKTKATRNTKVTLSLDIPTSIMQVLFTMAKDQSLQAKANANAQLMAQIGRRK